MIFETQILLDNKILHLFPGRKREYIRELKDQIPADRQARVKNQQDLRNFIQNCPKYNDRWAIELYQEYVKQIDKKLESRIKKNSWIISSLQGRIAKTGQITDADIAQAREVPIETLYEGGNLRRVAGRLSGLCPFHKERTASFSIYTQQNSWWCYSCSEGGSVIDFVMKIRECGFLDAVKFLVKK